MQAQNIDYVRTCGTNRRKQSGNNNKNNGGMGKPLAVLAAKERNERE